MKIIINADDFGLANKVNLAIRDAFQCGLISSTTLMANMPGFEEAVEMINSGTVPKKSVGIHLNLFEGIPLTDEMRENLLYCDEVGHFRYKAGHISFSAPKTIANTIIRKELEAQIQKILGTGLVPTHLDSHAHYHNNWYVGKIVIDLAKKYNIPYIRSPMNLSFHSFKSKLLNFIFDRRKRLERNCLKKCDFVGNIFDVRSFYKDNSKRSAFVEMMVHPIYNEEGVIVDAEFHAPLAKLLDFLHGVELWAYSD